MDGFAREALARMPQASAELLFGLCGGRDMNVACREGGVQDRGIEWCR